MDWKNGLENEMKMARIVIHSQANLEPFLT